MSRLSRKNRDDINIKSSGGLLDLIDNGLKEIWRINDAELDYLCEVSSDEELKLLIDDGMSISGVKKVLTYIDEKLDEFYKKES